MHYRDLVKTDIPGAFIELCKYQQEIIKMYQEYIEKTLHQHIIEKDTRVDDPLTLTSVVYKEITIPETKLVMNCSPACAFEWKWLKETTPLISPDYFISMAYKESEEKKNAETD